MATLNFSSPKKKLNLNSWEGALQATWNQQQAPRQPQQTQVNAGPRLAPGMGVVKPATPSIPSISIGAGPTDTVRKVSQMGIDRRAGKYNHLNDAQFNQQISDVQKGINRQHTGELNAQDRSLASSLNSAVFGRTARGKETEGLYGKYARNVNAPLLNIAKVNYPEIARNIGEYADTMTKGTPIDFVGGAAKKVLSVPARTLNTLAGREAGAEYAPTGAGSQVNTENMRGGSKLLGEFTGMVGDFAEMAVTPYTAMAGIVSDTGQRNYDELVAQGVSPGEARIRSAVSGVTQAAVERLTNKLQVSMGGSLVGKKAAQMLAQNPILKNRIIQYIGFTQVSGGTEAAEEVTQKIIDNIATNKPWNEGTVDAAEGGYKGGVMLGGVTGLAARSQANQQANQPTDAQRQVEDKRNRVEMRQDAQNDINRRVEDSAKQSNQASINKQLQQALNPKPYQMGNDKKEMSQAEADYKNRRAIERQTNNPDLPAFQRNDAKSVQDMRGQVERRLMEVGLDEDSYQAEQSKLAREYQSKMKALESKPEVTRTKLARDLDQEYEGRLAELDSRFDETKKLVSVLGKLPQSRPDSSDNRVSMKQPEQTQSVVQNTTPEAKPEVSVSQPEKSKLAPVSMKTPRSVEETITGRKSEEIREGDGKTRFGFKRGESVLTKFLTKPAERVAKKAVSKALSSGNRVLQTPARLAQTVFGDIATDNELAEQRGKFKGGSRYGGVLGNIISKEILSNDTINYSGDAGVRRRIYNHLDPEIAEKRGEDPNALSPQEKAVADRLREVIDAAHEEAYQAGAITEEQYLNNKGRYATRSYEIYEFPEEINRWAKKNGIKLPNELSKKRKKLTKGMAENALDDPLWNVIKQIDYVERFKAIKAYGEYISGRNDLVSDSPKAGFVEVGDSPYFGSLAGKYLRVDIQESIMGFGFQSEALSAMYNMLNKYDRFLPRQVYKKVRTVYDPGVRIGNRLYNYPAVAMYGIDPVTQTETYYKGAKMITENHPIALMLEKEGILGTDVISVDLKQDARFRTIDEKSGVNAIVASLTGLDKKVSDSYGRVDDNAKIGMYLALIKKGWSQKNAIKAVRRRMQDYNTVGKAWDISAKLPMFGKTFGRFTGDFLRTTTNTMVDRPLSMIGLIAGWAALANAMSEASGESEEDRKTRENRLGAGKLPGTNISTEIQTPIGAIDIRRYLGPSILNDDKSSTVENNLWSVSPIEKPWVETVDPVTKQKSTSVSAKAAGSDVLIGGIVQQILDRDFKNDPITDPDRDKYPGQPLSQEETNRNRLEHLVRSYSPNILNQGRDIKSAADGEENFYGSKRSVPQAFGRALGVRVEQYGPEQAKKARETEAYFDGRAEDVNNFLRENPDLVDIYRKIDNPEKGREGSRTYEEGKKINDIITPEKWTAIKSDTSGRIFGFMKEQAFKAYQDDKRPIDPIFKLPTDEQTRIVTDLRSRPTGEDIESEEILRANHSWYRNLEKAERKYYEDSDAYWKTKNLPDTANARPEAYANVGFAEQPPLVEKYYKLKEKDPDAAKALFETTNLSDEFEKYSAERLKIINAKRKIEGFPPISKNTFDNVTFGYEEDERKVYNELKYGKGYGGYGSGSGSSYNKYYGISASAGGVSKPSVRRVSTARRRKQNVASASKTTAPKVTLKKSNV